MIEPADLATLLPDFLVRQRWYGANDRELTGVEIAALDDDVLLTWTTVGGKKYAVQALTGDYTNNFVEFEPVIIAPGTGESTFSVIDLGAATNVPERFYRVRLVP